MPPLPKRRTSKSRKGERRSHRALNPSQLVTCPQCRNIKQSHHVCPFCGFYRGKQIITIVNP